MKKVILLGSLLIACLDCTFVAEDSEALAVWHYLTVRVELAILVVLLIRTMLLIL